MLSANSLKQMVRLRFDETGQIIEISAGVRPAFPDNVPRAIVRGRYIHVNGAYRHGYLMAPALARITADLLEHDRRHNGIVVDA